MTNISMPGGSLAPRSVQTALGPVEYLEYGEGPVIVSLHGAMGGYDQSRILAETLLQGEYRVIAVSRPGYLGTPLSSGATPEAQADLVAALLDQLKIPSARVIAISGGGPCAIHFALRHAERCKALVLTSTVSKPNPVKIPLRYYLIKLLAYFPAVLARMKGRALSDIGQAAARSIHDKELLAQLLSDPDTLRLFTALTASTFERMRERMRGSDNDFMLTSTREYPLEALRVATLIIHGSADPYADFARHAISAAERIPGAELLELRGGEHAAIFTHRRLVQERLRAFMQHVGA